MHLLPQHLGPGFGFRPEKLIADLNSHLACRSGNCAEGGLFAVRVEILHLDLHDVHNLLLESFATLVLLGSLEPAARPAAFFKRTEAGGDFVIKENVLSL